MRTLLIGAATLIVAAPAYAASPLVSADWLAENLGSEDLAILDIRNRIDGGSAEAFGAAHIPGAVYSSYTDDGWRRDEDGVPGMLPPVQDLEALIGGLGIDSDAHVVIVYGGVSSSDFGSAARVYWTFTQLGHEQLSILDGGYAAWTADPARPVASGQTDVEPTVYEARQAEAGTLATAADVADAIDGPAVLLDGRPASQFAGVDKHPAAARAGHVPSAVSFDQARWFEPESGQLRDTDAVLASLPAGVLDGDDEVISYCNTGHWAATNWFMLNQVLGRENVTLYDGSMTGWTADASRPVATSMPAAN